MRSAMDCSSDESSELSKTDIDDYAEKSYLDLKAGKFVARLGSDRFRCPFCPGKKKQDYRYNELLQHAVGVGASNRAAKVKANHQALAKLLKEDHADAAATLPPCQAIALSNPPKPVQDLEVFVWPWMGILTNVLAEQTQGGGGILMKQLADFKPVQVTAVDGDNGYTGYVIVLFTKDCIGFKNALAFHNYFKSQHLGKLDWKETKQHVKDVFGWLAKEEDYKSDDPVGRFLSSNGGPKTVSELEQEMSSKTDNLIANLTQQSTKCNKMNLSLQKVMEESDLLHKRYNEEMRNMQSAARKHTHIVFQETEKLRNELVEKESYIQWRSRQLNEQVAQTDMKRRKLEEERKKNADQNDSLNMARIEQQKADEWVLQLLEKHKEEKEVAVNRILQFERQVYEKQKLELDIEQLKGKLEVVKHIEGEGVDVKKRSEELTAELNERIEEMEHLEDLNQTLVVKERMASDEI
ncbi:factor of DNA methylation 5-like [Miscanthus floridulus]|uniref:factor of DNA methylation 5-like n=1 Tax=Miscanthus floridulus TaxID=154761 RepID=UPI00345A11E8